MTTSSRPIIFLTGGTGLLGSYLASRWLAAGYEVRALTRHEVSEAPRNGVRWFPGDLTQGGDWQAAVDGAQSVVHLGGEAISSGRWTVARKASLRRSRIEGTQRVVEAMEAASKRPSTFLCASATGYYGPRGDELLDEASGCGHDFLAQLSLDWEKSAQTAEPLGLRVVRLRFGAILSLRGGALARLLPFFRIGLGGPMGPRANFVPWIHEDDAAGLIDWALRHEGLSGPVNAVSPGEIRMGDFVRTLGRELRRPTLIPIPGFLLRLVLGEMGGALFPGQRVEPRAALGQGYEFRFDTFSAALAALLGEAA
ncbi:MAG: TIGR01777 family oxidoreductase [Myxococcota bacterium]|nr:TIGR01777 family oxidoreductase [Myxococcota bacterium]